MLEVGQECLRVRGYDELWVVSTMEVSWTSATAHMILDCSRPFPSLPPAP